MATDKATFPSDAADKYVVRFPDGMRDRIAEAAKASGRSMNAEILSRLQLSFDIPDEKLGGVERMLRDSALLETSRRVIRMKSVLRLLAVLIARLDKVKDRELLLGRFKDLSSYALENASDPFDRLDGHPGLTPALIAEIRKEQREADERFTRMVVRMDMPPEEAIAAFIRDEGIELPELPPDISDAEVERRLKEFDTPRLTVADIIRRAPEAKPATESKGHRSAG